MTDKKPDKAKQAASKGAVEVDEKDLDKAEGGFFAYSVPTDSSINFAKTLTTDSLAQKVSPTLNPGAGLSVDPSNPNLEKKI